MKREDFVALPTALALGLIWDRVPGVASALADALCPVPAKPPKFDTVLYRKEGMQYASECDVKNLRYYHMRSVESAAKGGEWAEKDRKRATALQYFIEWRLVDPYSRWTGERNREKVTAEPPSAFPKVYPREQRGFQEPKRARNFDEAPEGEPVDDFDETPF